VNVLSAVLSDRPSEAFATLRFYPLGVTLYLGTAAVVASGGFRRLSAGLSVVVVAFAADICWQRTTGTSWLRGARGAMWNRYMGSLVYPGDASMLPILGPLASAAWVERKRSWPFLVVAIGLVAVAVVASGTRAALAGVLLGAIALGWIAGRRGLAILLLAVVLAMTIGGALFGASSAPNRLLSPRTYVGEQRLLQWKAAWELAREAPLLGHGPHSFRRLCIARHGEPGSIFSKVDLQWAPYPHDLYLEALVGTGALGLAAFVTLLWLPIRDLRGPAADPIAARAVTTTVALFALIGIVDLSLMRDWVQLCFWLPLGVAAGLRRSLRAPEA
jgi:O-antigen ligase